MYFKISVTISLTTGLHGKVKSGKGKTGIDLRYYPYKEFKKFSQDKQDELNAWQAKNTANNKRPGDDNKNGSKRQRCGISSLISNNDAAFQAIA